MTSRMYRPWLERVTGPVMTEGHIRQFRHAIVPLAHDYPAGGQQLTMTYDEASDIVEAFKARVRVDGGPLVTEEQAEKGRRWLTGQQRRLGLPDVDYGNIDRFRFEAVHIDWEGTNYRMSTAPVYRAFWLDGTEFVYWATPWTARAYGNNPDPIQFTLHRNEAA
jgi:hypothetical protein